MLNAESNDRAEEVARAALRRMKVEGIAAHATTRFGSAASEILDVVAETATDLVIIGAHARHGWPGLFVGNTALKVAKGAPCSVLIARSCAATTQRVKKRDGDSEGVDEDVNCTMADGPHEGADEPV